LPPEQSASYFALSADNPLFDIPLVTGVSLNWVWYFSALAVLGLIWAAFTDLYRGRLLPDIVPLVIGVGGLAAAPFALENPWINLACGAAVGAIFGLGVVFGWVGLGDVKYYVAIALAGGLVGIAVILLAHVYAAFIGGGVALVRRNRKLQVPMAPFMALAALSVLALVGAPVWLTLSLLGAFVLVLLVGLVEAQRFAPPTLADVCAPLRDGAADRIRVRAGSRPQWRALSGEWNTPDSGRTMTPGLIDRLLHEIALEGEEQQDFYATDTTLLERDVAGEAVAIRLDAGMYHRVTLRAVRAAEISSLAE